ncbi:unnamed protein product [Parajaminaea phylloscopi]
MSQSMLTPQARAKQKTTSNHPRQSSGVYNTFSTKQIQGFKEAFSMLDQPTADGLLTRADLKETLANLGQDDSSEAIRRFFESSMAGSMSDASGTGQGSEGINFTQFLTMFGDHLSEMDDAASLLDAFECFDEKDDGVIDVEEMRYWLSEVGDRMSDAEIDRLLSGPFMDRAGKKFDYKAFVEAVKVSEPAELD